MKEKKSVRAVMVIYTFPFLSLIMCACVYLSLYVILYKDMIDKYLPILNEGKESQVEDGKRTNAKTF